jgi:hypothetical protein
VLERFPALGFGGGLEERSVCKQCLNDFRSLYLESTVQTVLHDGNELLVGQQTVAVLIKDSENGVNQMLVQFGAGADFNGPLEFVLRNGAVGQRVHSHRDGKVVQIVEELAECSKLFERHTLDGGLTVQQTVQK